MNNHFLTVPVYRLASDRYYKERDTFVNEKLNQTVFINEAMQINYKHSEARKKHKEYLINNYGPWNYNEIIGFIELYFIGSQIRGEYWQMEAKRLTRTRTKIFRFVTSKLSCELDISQEATNLDIFHIIKKYLLNCNKELKNRFIDSHHFDIIGKFVDWNRLINNANVN